MATPSALGPGPKDVLSPQDAFAQSQLQRRLALAQMLQQNAQEAGGAYGSLNGMRVVPRMGLGPAISQIANSLLGGYEQKKAMGDQQALYQQMAQRQAAAIDNAWGSPSAGMSPSSDASQSQGGQLPPSGVAGNIAQAVGVDPTTGLSKAQFADMYRQDPYKAQEYLASHRALTDQNKQYEQQGLNLHDMGQLTRAADVVKGTQTFQPGTTNIIPGVNQPFVAADFSKGTVGGYDQNGQPTLQGINGNGVISQLAGQQQLATQLNTIQPVTMSNGAVVPMTGAQALGGQAPQGFGAQIQAESGGNQNAVSSAGARGVAQLMPATARQYEQKMGFPQGSSDTDPKINAAIGQQYMSDLTDKYTPVAGGDKNAAQVLARMAYNAGPGKIDAWMAGGMNPADLPKETQDYNGRVNAAGGLPAPVPTMGGQVGIGQSTQDKALADKRAGNIADLEQDINDKAALAQSKLANNQKMMALIPQITKGPLAGHITDAKNVLNSLGWTGPDPTNNQEFEKYSMQAALNEARQVYGNRITNADLMTLPHWNPSASMTENALRTIIESDNIKQNRQLQRQQVYNAYRDQGGDLNQFPAYFNKNYPDQGIAAPASLTPGAQAAAKTVLKFNPATGKLEGG